MKKIFLLIALFGAFTSVAQNKKTTLRDGVYEVLLLGEDTTQFNNKALNAFVIPFDTMFNPENFTKVQIDTSDFIPLILETSPSVELQSNQKKLLSVTLTPQAAEKMKTFTSKRVMKRIVIVLDNKAITMHKIREAITGDKLQITRCNDNACEHLLVILNKNLKK